MLVAVQLCIECKSEEGKTIYTEGKNANKFHPSDTAGNMVLRDVNIHLNTF
jgi:hypothetical protein